MKKPGSIFLALFLFIPCVFPVHAQSPAIFSSDRAIAYGASFSVPIQVNQFDNITGLQFIISWDSTLLRYKGVEHPALDIQTQKHFGASAASAGILRFLWFEESLAPVSLPDGSTLFEIRFECIGKSQETTSILFTEDDLTKIEVYDKKYRKLEVQFKEALVSIKPTPVNEQINNHKKPISFLNTYPNPFSNSTSVSFTLDQDGLTLLKLYDLSGKKIHEETFDLNRGNHKIVLAARHFPVPGVYVCRIESSGGSISQEIIFK